MKVAGRRFDSRSAVVGTSETGLEAHVVIQSDLNTDDAEIIYKRVSLGPPPVVLGAQPVIENNAATTNKNPVSVTFANVRARQKSCAGAGTPPRPMRRTTERLAGLRQPQADPLADRAGF